MNVETEIKKAYEEWDGTGECCVSESQMDCDMSRGFIAGWKAKEVKTQEDMLTAKSVIENKTGILIQTTELVETILKSKLAYIEMLEKGIDKMYQCRFEPDKIDIIKKHIEGVKSK